MSKLKIQKFLTFCWLCFGKIFPRSDENFKYHATFLARQSNASMKIENMQWKPVLYNENCCSDLNWGYEPGLIF